MGLQLRCQVRATVVCRLDGLEGLLPEELTHMAGKLILAVGKNLSSFPDVSS